jgi:hypothetical protein
MIHTNLCGVPFREFQQFILQIPISIDKLKDKSHHHCTFTWCLPTLACSHITSGSFGDIGIILRGLGE